MKKFLAVFLFLLTSPLWADDSLLDRSRLALFAVTNHLHSSNLNDLHPMLQIEYDSRWVGGLFQNSHRDVSFYVARRWQSKHVQGRPFVEIGAVTGYSRPLMRSLRIGVELNDHLDFVIMPEFDGDSLYRVRQPVSVLGLILKF